MNKLLFINDYKKYHQYLSSQEITLEIAEDIDIFTSFLILMQKVKNNYNFDKYNTFHGYDYNIKINNERLQSIVDNKRFDSGSTLNKQDIMYDLYMELYKLEKQFLNNKDNFQILKNMLFIRKKMANELGFKNWSDFTLKNQILNTPEQVLNFLKNLNVKKNYNNFPECNLYFTFNIVMHKIFNMLNVFGLTLIKNYYKVWNEQVFTYDVFIDNKFAGVIYFDLFFRENKNSNICDTNIISSGSKNNYPSCVIVMNLYEFVNIRNILDFSHELGHAIHMICSGYNKEYHYSGSQYCEIDFVEIPSQFFECYIIDNINFITGEEIDTRYLYKDWKNIIDYAIYDINLHTRGLLTIRQIKMLSDPSINEFEHLASEYASRYYCYVYGFIVALNMYNKFKYNKDGINFRKKVLEPGCTLKGRDIIYSYIDNLDFSLFFDKL